MVIYFSKMMHFSMINAGQVDRKAGVGTSYRSRQPPGSSGGDEVLIFTLYYQSITPNLLKFSFECLEIFLLSLTMECCDPLQELT